MQDRYSHGISAPATCVWVIVALLWSTSAPARAAEQAEALDGWRQALAKAVEQAQLAKQSVIEGNDGWLYFVPELRHLSVGAFWGEDAPAVSRASKVDWADPLPAIVDFARQLADADIELIVVPVPAKAAVYPGHLPESLQPKSNLTGRLDATHVEFYELLRKQGVNVVDLTPVFDQAEQDSDSTHGPRYCLQDTHWSGVACVDAARVLSEAIKAMPWYGATAKKSFDANWREQTITGDLYGMLEIPPDLTERLSLRFVTGAEGKPVEPDRDSPVLVVGDSHTLVFHAGDDMHAVGAGLTDQLAYELGFSPDLVGVRGSGATASRIALLRRGDNLAGKKVVIWVFSAREFTEGRGWRKVPVIR